MTTKLSKWTPTTNLKELRRLGKTCEELGELVAVLGRTICQGLDGIDPASGESNIERITKESADVLAQIHCNVNAFALDRNHMGNRVADKTVQMHQWEAMFEPADPTEPWAPKLGELVRYGDGSTALALHGEPHAGGWHGLQCMGGHTFYSKVYQPTRQDRLQWVECAIRWRHQSPSQAAQEAGLTLGDAQ